MHNITVLDPEANTTTRLSIGCEDQARSIYHFVVRVAGQENVSIEVGPPPLDRAGDEIERAANWISHYAQHKNMKAVC